VNSLTRRTKALRLSALPTRVNRTDVRKVFDTIWKTLLQFEEKHSNHFAISDQHVRFRGSSITFYEIRNMLQTARPRDPSSCGQPIQMISVCCFQRSARSNLQPYPKALSFWWPIIEARACHHSDSAGPLLLAPIFRWAFLGRRDKLEALESHLVSFEGAVGSRDFQRFRNQLCDDLRGIAIENDAHNRLLSAWTEIRAVLRLSAEVKTVSLIPPGKKKNADLSIVDKGESYLVEAKYIRPPDKLEDYLFRWWQAQKEVAGNLPPELGTLPHLKFDWEPIESRDELSKSEIDRLSVFFTEILLHPAKERSLSSRRLTVTYRPDRQLPISLMPLPERALQSQCDREPLFDKLRIIVNKAEKQVAEGQGRIVFLFLNLSTDITFLWPERFAERFEALRKESAAKGIDLLFEEVGYL
jgi:hypothetical protein